MSGQSSKSEYEILVGEKEEERKLAEQCCSSLYRLQAKVIRVTLMLASIKLVAEPTDPQVLTSSSNHKLRRESLVPRNILRPVAGWLGRLVWPPDMSLLTILYFHYVFVKMMTIAVLLLRRHLILSQLKSSVQPPQVQRTTNNSCILSEDMLHFSKPDDWAKFEQLKSLQAWLKFLGLGIVSMPAELSVASMFTVAILPLVYHHLCQLILSLDRLRADTLYFALNPLSERQRIGADLKNIVRELIMSQSNHKDNLYYGFENSRALNSKDELVVASGRLLGVRRMQVASGSRGNPKCLELAAGGSRQKLMSDQVRRLRFLQNLAKIRQLKQVDPYIVTSNWHRILLRLIILVDLGICLAIVYAGILIPSVMLYDLVNITHLRLEMADCQTEGRPQGSTNFVAALDYLYLDELESAEQLDAYKTHDGSTLSLIKLALLVESSNYFSLGRAIFWIEIVLASYFLDNEWLLSLSLHVGSTIEQIVWLYQLDKQVERAANQAAEHAQLARRFGPTLEKDEQLLNTLTLVYLNFELFRRQQDEHLMLSDRMTICFTVLATMICLIIYCSGVILGGSSLFFVLAVCPVLLGTMNLFLLPSSYRLKRVEKIMTKASRILAHCSSGQLQLSYPVELWRRQVREQSCERYASRLFGINVTYETIISLNGYAVALLLILLKPQHGPLHIKQQANKLLEPPP